MGVCVGVCGCGCAIGTERDTERPRKRGAETQTEGGFTVRHRFLFLTGNLKTMLWEFIASPPINPLTTSVLG